MYVYQSMSMYTHIQYYIYSTVRRVYEWFLLIERDRVEGF